MRRQYLLSFSLGAMTLVLLGCDAFLRVQGVLILDEGDVAAQCRASLSDRNNQYSRPREISGAFEEGWTVSPWSRDFELQIACDGYQVKRLAFESKGPEPANLGRIVMQAEAKSRTGDSSGGD